MTPQNKTKEKVLAVLTVFFLFLLSGGLFFSISLDNKHKTEILNAKVAKRNMEEKIIENMAKIKTATSTLPEITGTAYLTLAVADNGLKKILQQKNTDWALPIASITKLMVAIVATENIDSDTEIKATRDYIGLEESAFVLETGKIYTVKELLANMLIASDNDSARLLGSALGTDNFIAKMNAKARELNLTKTNYFNLTGLDPKKPALNANISSPNDLANLLLYVKKQHPEILKLTENPSYVFCDVNNYCKTITNTDKLLNDNGLKFKIVGSKTGTTDMAGKNLVLMTEPFDGIILINVVLGAKDSFADTKGLINNIIIN